jgi:hypothetical protein
MPSHSRLTILTLVNASLTVALVIARGDVGIGGGTGGTPSTLDADDADAIDDVEVCVSDGSAGDTSSNLSAIGDYKTELAQSRSHTSAGRATRAVRRVHACARADRALCVAAALSRCQTANSSLQHRDQHASHRHHNHNYLTVIRVALAHLQCALDEHAIGQRPLEHLQQIARCWRQQLRLWRNVHA